MCCCFCFTCCDSGNCGFCSECVASAACNPTLCGDCLTGGEIPCFAGPDLKTGSEVGLCCHDTPEPIAPCFASCAIPCSPLSHGATDNPPATCVAACLPYVGQDSSGNEIYKNQDGSLTYADGTPATQADVTCREGACNPNMAAKAGNAGAGSSGSSNGGGSGSSGGGGGGPKSQSQQPANKVSVPVQKQLTLSQKLGSTLGSLFSGGTATVPAKTLLLGQPAPKSTAVTSVSSNSFLLVIVVLSVLLLMITFGRGE